MKSIINTALAVAATAALAGCASYDYGYPYGYNYGSDYGPYSYNDNGYYYDYGPSYVAPSVGFGFTYRDRDANQSREPKPDSDGPILGIKVMGFARLHRKGSSCLVRSGFTLL